MYIVHVHCICCRSVLKAKKCVYKFVFRLPVSLEGDLWFPMFLPQSAPLTSAGGSGQFYPGSPSVVCVWGPVLVPIIPRQTARWLAAVCVALPVLARV